MKKNDNPVNDDFDLDDDLSAFEELEDGDMPAEGDDAVVEEGKKTEPVVESKKVELPLEEELIDDPIDDVVAEEVIKEKSVSQTNDFSKELGNLAPDVPVNIVAVIGKKRITVEDLLKFRVGSAIELSRPANEIVDIVANGRMIAKGELVDIDGKLGVKIIKIVKS